MIFTLPLFLIFDVSGWEPFSWPTSETWGFLCLNAFVGTLVSDYIWLWSTLLTTPAVTTLGLSLTIPLAISLDVIFGKLSLTGLYLLGTGLVFLGFLLINLEVLYNISVVTLYVKLKAACMS